MKKRTTITTEKREVWIITEGVTTETVGETDSPFNEATVETEDALTTTTKAPHEANIV